MRRQVHRDGSLPLLFEYTEENMCQSEAWLIFEHLGGDAQRLRVFLWDMRKAQEDIATVGLTCREPQVRGWQRHLSAAENQAWSDICAAVRAKPEIREGIVLDGVTCELVLQEVEPVVLLRWNAFLAGEGLTAMMDWLEVIRLRRFLRG